MPVAHRAQAKLLVLFDLGQAMRSYLRNRVLESAQRTAWIKLFAPIGKHDTASASVSSEPNNAQRPGRVPRIVE
jgi:hypothetical protein